MSKLMKNKDGEYNYHFNWMNEDGIVTGWNNVWAKNMKEARKEAKKRETKAHWFTYDIRVDGEVIKNGGKTWNKGMYIKPDSFKKQTYEFSAEMDRIGNLMTC